MLSYRLRHRVQIQSVTRTQDAVTGEMATAWADLTICGSDGVPAEVLLGPGKEFPGSGTTQAQIDARINMRWFPELTQEMRIVWDGRTFNIESMETDLTGRQEWRLKCSSGVNHD